MRPRRKLSAVCLLPTITEVQESVPHIYHTHSLDDYMDSIRELSQPFLYGHHHTQVHHYDLFNHLHHHRHHHPDSLNPLPCRRPSTKMSTPRQAKFPLMASMSVPMPGCMSASVSALVQTPPVSVVGATLDTGNQELELALDTDGTSESISLTLASPSTMSSSEGRTPWWPHQDPIGWLFTQSQDSSTSLANALPIVDNVPDSVCLV